MMKFALLILIASGVCSLSAEPRAEGQFDRNLTVNGPVDLDAATGAGGIRVTRGSGNTVRVHAILEAEDGWLGSAEGEAHIREIERNPPVEQNGNSVRVGYVADPRLLDGVAMRLEIEVPERTRVHAHAHSGGLRISGVQGPVEGTTHSGQIEVRDIEGDVDVSAHSGGVRLWHIGGAVVAQTHSGGVEAFEISGAIDARTNSGGIRLSQAVARPVHARASSGGVWLSLARGAGYTLNISTVSGRISVPEMTMSSSFSRHRVGGEIHGGGQEVVIRSSSGPVRVE